MTIEEKIGRPALLDQLSEECVELAHAALKMSRKLRGVNPTPATIEEITENVVEEIADVTVCINFLIESGFVSYESVESVFMEKSDRWENRLEEAENGRKTR